ncbi:unnamed protein product [Rhizoctonia solani]|uniref:Jacalin-type lectin domain-containing protein n=1 Tax=Rhizoctonia solani TaxID=456999 RepID=A0A8H3C1X9_9AGAM|nr:unnamed protein product [Rhizoctonia solani]
MATVGDPELAAYVEMHKCCVEAEEAAVLAKVDEMLSTTPHSHTHDASPAEDAQKIADDALGLLFNFEEIGAELALTNDGQFKKEWDDAYQEFRKGLEEAVKLAEMGKKYLLDFNEKVVSRFSEGNVDWEKDKDLVADFVKLFGRRNRVFSAANNRVSQLQREEQDLLAQRAAVDRRANELVKDAAALTQTRHAMSVLVDNVGDMTGRLGTLASSWSQINQQFEYMGEMLKVATDSKSQDTFARRMSNIGKSTSFLTANMDAWTKGIAPDGVLAKPKKKPSSYDISNSYGGSDGVAFNDARPELDSAISIASIKVVRSAGIDGLHVTYRLKNGTLETKQHGQDRSNNFDEINLKETEYINMVSGIHIPTGIHQLRMQITDSATGTRRSVGPYGTGAGLAGGASFTWTGRLLCFAGVANNSVPSLGLRGIKFVQMKS